MNSSGGALEPAAATQEEAVAATQEEAALDADTDEDDAPAAAPAAAWGLLSSRAALLELDQFAKFTLGDECDSINAALARYHELGDLMPGEPSCFGVSPTLDAGYWLLLTCVVASTIFGWVAMHGAHLALRERRASSRAIH